MKRRIEIAQIILLFLSVMWFWSLASADVASASSTQGPKSIDVDIKSKAHKLFYTESTKLAITKVAGTTTKKVAYLNTPVQTKPIILPEKKNYWPYRPGVNCAALKCIAITFDDGPSEYTTQLLDLLKNKDIKATFFVLGLQAEKYPSILPRILAEGHEIGNHTYHHKNLKNLSAVEVNLEVNSTANLIYSLTNYWPHVLRPPMGEFTDADPALTKTPIILWNADPWDWKYRNSAKIDSEVLAQVAPGSVLIMHDIYQTSVDAVPSIIDNLKQQGYTFVTVSELFGWQNSSAILPNGQVLRGR